MEMGGTSMADMTRHKQDQAAKEESKKGLDDERHSRKVGHSRINAEYKSTDCILLNESIQHDNTTI